MPGHIRKFNWLEAHLAMWWSLKYGGIVIKDVAIVLRGVR